MSNSILGRTPEPAPSEVRPVLGGCGAGLLFMVALAMVLGIDVLMTDLGEWLSKGIVVGSLFAGLAAYREIKKRQHRAWEKREAERESAQF